VWSLRARCGRTESQSPGAAQVGRHCVCRERNDTAKCPATRGDWWREQPDAGGAAKRRLGTTAVPAAVGGSTNQRTGCRVQPDIVKTARCVRRHRTSARRANPCGGSAQVPERAGTYCVSASQSIQRPMELCNAVDEVRQTTAAGCSWDCGDIAAAGVCSCTNSEWLKADRK